MKKIHRFWYDVVFAKGLIEITDTQLVHQLKNVLKLRPDEQIVLFNHQLEEASVTLTELKKELAVGRIVDIHINKAESPVFVSVYAAMLKKENFEWLAQKVTEVGGGAIIPLMTDRTIKQNLSSPRIQRIVQEATEQSGRAKIPDVRDAISFQEFLTEAIPAHDVVYVCDASGTPIMQTTIPGKKVAICIGPEGGLTEHELAAARAAGAQIIRLGSTVLRAETAATVAVATLAQFQLMGQ